MNKKPKWVIFDVGGVLYDFKGFIKHISRHLNIEEKIVEKELFEIIARSERGEMTFDEVWINLLKRFKRESEHENIINIWWGIKHWMEDTRLLVKQVNEAGYLIALFTNNWTKMSERVRQNISDKPIIREVFESSVEKLSKPDIKFYELVEKRVKASGNEIYFIDNSKPNIETAQKVGWQTFHYDLGEDEGKTSNDLIRKNLL